MVQPAASAGPALRVIIAAGKFHGVIAATNADRLLQHDDALVGREARNRIAIDALCFLAEPFDEACGIGDLALGLRERLALLRRHDGAEIVLVRHHQIEPAAQHRRALFGGPGTPCRHRRIGEFDGAPGLDHPHIGDVPDHGAGRGISTAMVPP